MQCVELAINIFLAHACFTGAAHSDAALAAFVVWMAVNSFDLVIGFLLCPPAFSFSDIEAIFLRALGFSMAAYTAGIVSLLMVVPRSIWSIWVHRFGELRLLSVLGLVWVFEKHKP
jgi:hypothetical protein